MFRACGFGYHVEPKVASKDVFKSDDVIGAQSFVTPFSVLEGGEIPHLYMCRMFRNGNKT